MVDGEFFQKLEEIARFVRKNDKPFGGIQLILSGDFLQLPPVCRKGENKKFCFQVIFSEFNYLKDLFDDLISCK